PPDLPRLLRPAWYSCDEAARVRDEDSSCHPCGFRRRRRISERAVARVSAFGIAGNRRGSCRRSDGERIGGDCRALVPRRTVFCLFVPPQETDPLGLAGRKSDWSCFRPVVVCRLGLRLDLRQGIGAAIYLGG